MKSIAIIRLSSLGDIVHSLPAFQLLRSHFPSARITWISEAPGAALLENFSGIDELAVFHLKSCAGVTAKLRFLIRFVRRWRGQFDVILDFQGLIKSALLAFLLGRKRLGFGAGNVREPLAAFFYSQRAAFFTEDWHVIRKNIHLLSLLGIHADTVAYPQWKPALPPRLQNFLQQWVGLESRYVILNVGGGWPTKILSEKQWLQVIDGLKPDFPLVLLWGNVQERRLAEALQRQREIAIVYAMDFAELIAFIGRARLLISGDTLALHLADMTRTPAVGIFGPTSPQRNGPLFSASRVVFQKQECGFCYRRKCDTMVCVEKIAMADVVIAARKIDESLDRNAD